MKTLISTVLLILCIPMSQAFATWQVRDKIIIEGTERSINADPLWRYLWLEEKTEYFDSEEKSSACWRGYIARWTLRENRLFLLDIERCPEKTKVNLEDLFGDESSAPLFANWYSGYLTISDGDVLFYDPRTYEEIRESDIIYQVDSGKIVRQIRQDGRKKLIDRLLIEGEVVIPEVKFEKEPAEQAVKTLLELSIQMIGQAENIENERREIKEKSLLILKKASLDIHISDELKDTDVTLSLRNLSLERCFHYLFEAIDADCRIIDSNGRIIIEVFPNKSK